MITIDVYEANSPASYGHHVETGKVSYEMALGALVAQFDPNIGITVQSIEDNKVVIFSSYSMHVEGLVEPEDDGITPRSIYSPYGFAIVFSYVPEDGAPISGVQSGYGFSLLQSTVWAYLHMDEHFRGDDIKRMFAERDTQELAPAS